MEYSTYMWTMWLKLIINIFDMDYDMLNVIKDN